MIDAKDIIRRLDRLADLRSPWEQDWQTCSDYVLPRSGLWDTKNARVFDSTAPRALGRFAAALESTLTPRGNKWHDLAPENEELGQIPEVAQFCKKINDALFAARYKPVANFANQMVMAYLSLGVHGTAVVFVDDDPRYGLRYKCIPLREIYLAEDAAGLVDTVFRKYELTARQALQEFGEELPENILKDAGSSERQENRHGFVHAVFPRRDVKNGKKDARNMPLASVHVAVNARKVVRESGYRKMPYAVSRFEVIPGDVYGRSPAMTVMPDIIQVNEMVKTILRAGQKAVDPPLLLPDDEVITAFSLMAGSLNFGGLDSEGRQLVQPLQTGTNLPIGLELINESRQVINDVFYITLFQILVEQDRQQTATEVMARAQEKAQLLAPAMGRQQSELLRAVIDREMDVLWHRREFKYIEVPGILREIGGVEIVPRYVTNMAKALKSVEAGNLIRGMEAVVAVSQIDPAAIDWIQGDTLAKDLWEAVGADMGALRSDEEVEEIRAERAQQEQIQQAVQQAAMAGQLAGQYSEVANNVVETEATAQGLGGGHA